MIIKVALLLGNVRERNWWSHKVNLRGFLVTPFFSSNNLFQIQKASPMR